MKAKTAILVVIATLTLIIGVQAAHAYSTTNDPPWANFTSGSSHPMVFGETRFSVYGSENDNVFGADHFSFQTNAEATQTILICDPACVYVVFYYDFQPFVQFASNTFSFTPQIWNAQFGGLPNQAWKGATAQSGLNVPASQLANYAIFEAVNDGSSPLTVDVSSCNVPVTVKASSMYAGVLQYSTCSILWSNSQAFPTSFEIPHGFIAMQTGVLGYGSLIFS